MGDFEAFYREHVQLVFALAMARSGDRWQAEDLTQETFLRAWQQFQVLSSAPPISRRAWLVRVLRNLAVDGWRRTSLSAAAKEKAGPVPEAGQNADLRIDLTKALMELEETNRDLVIMRFLEGMNSREIGAVMGMPQGTVRRRLAESRKVLAQRLSAWAPTGGPR